MQGSDRNELPIEPDADTEVGGDTPAAPAIGRPGDAPRSLGRYLLLEVLGAGGMGVVWAAYDPKLHRKLAVKLLHADDGEGGDQRARMLREAQAMARLSHPNVVQVYEVGERADGLFVAMEFVDGVDLRGWLRERPRRWRDILDMFLQAGHGLAAAHEVGLVHRDFKPANVFVGADGRARVGDFGLARGRLAEETSARPDVVAGASVLADDLTLTGAVLGTPAYMAPEQFMGRSADERTDQFAFCAALWEALYGQRAFAGETFATICQATVEGGIVPPPSGARVPRWLRPRLERGLAVAPGQRYPSMKALLGALSADPRPRRAALVAATLLVGALASWLVAHRVEQRRASAACDASAGDIDAVWSERTRAELREAFVATGLPFAAETADRVIPLLDEQALRWSAARVEVCRAATIEARWGRDLADQAEACLEDRLQGLGILIDTLMHPGQEARARGIVQGAARAVLFLPPVEACLDEAQLRGLPRFPDDEGTRRELQRLRRELVSFQLLSIAGLHREALPRAERVTKDAEALGWAPFRAVATLELGALLARLHRDAEAERVLEEAYFMAGSAGADDAYLEAATTLASLVGIRMRRVEEGFRWASTAQMLLDREGARPDDVRRSAVDVSFAALYAERDDLQRALEHSERALQLRERTLGLHHSSTSASLSQVAGLRWTLGEADRALELLSRGVAMTERSLGDGHPNLITPLIKRGDIAVVRGEHERALADYRRALALETDAAGPDTARALQLLLALGDAHRERGAYAQAAELYERARAAGEGLNPQRSVLAGVWQRLGDLRREQGACGLAIAAYERALELQESPAARGATAILLDRIGDALRRCGAPERAREYHERSLAIVEAERGLHHVDLLAPLAGLGAAHRALGDSDRAALVYERALAVAGRSPRAHLRHAADALTGLAEVQLERGQPGPARALLRRALAIREARAGELAPLAATRFALARAVFAENREEARGLAELAREGYRVVRAVNDPELVEVEAWLAEHGAASAP